MGAQADVPPFVRELRSLSFSPLACHVYTPEGYVPVRAQFRPAQAPKGTESTSRPDVFHLILVCAREERAKPIGDRRAGRWSPAERGRGGSGARPLAARLLRGTGAGNVGTGGRSCGAF